MRRALTRHILTAALLLGVILCGSCGKDDEPWAIPGDALYDFATVASTGVTETVFEMQRTEQSPVLRLRTPYSFTGNDHVKAGDRILICYTLMPGAEDAPERDITLYGYLPMSNTAPGILTDAADLPPGASGLFEMVSMWRTGPYLNINTGIHVQRPARPESFVLIADSATIDDECPALRLAYRMPEGESGENVSTVYASFDLSEVWERPTCRRVRVYYPTAEGITSTVFSKP